MVTIACILLYILINYGYVMNRYRRSSRAVPQHSLEPSHQRNFTVLVPFRNEEKRLPLLLNSISQLRYPFPQLHFIFINDASDDQSVEVIHRWRMQNGQVPVTVIDNIPHAKSPKKEAIQFAMGIVKTEWVVTTDADCVLPAAYFGLLDAFIQANPQIDAVAGGVRLQKGAGMANGFDRLDQLALQGLTLAAFAKGDYLMNNAANWAFTKQAFERMGGHRQHLHVVSGDDIFMLHQLPKYNLKALYLNNPNYIVETCGASNWKALFSQRLRWASKSSVYENPKITDLGYSTFLANFALVVAWVCTLITPVFAIALVLLYAYKFSIDRPILQVAVHNQLGRWPLGSIFGVIFYPIWTFFVALAALFKVGFNWKGRRFSA